MLLTPRIVRTHELTQEDLAPIYIGSQSNIGLTGPPQLIAQPPEPEPGAEATVPPAQAPAEPRVEPAVPGPAPRPGVPMPPAAAAPGVPSPPAAAPAGAPVPSQPPPTVRLPEGTAGVPTPAAGASPVPGTTTLPPPAPTQVPPAAPAPATPAVPPPVTPEPPAATPAAPPPAAGAQVVITTPGAEFRMGGGPYTVPISITNASRVSTITLSLSFNPAVLRVRTVQEASFMRQGGIAVAFTQQVDATSGRLDLTLTRTGDQTGASGAGLLAAVLFEPVAAGAATLSLSGVATTPQGQPVPLTLTPVTLTVR
jgi:hypothetical protein